MSEFSGSVPVNYQVAAAACPAGQHAADEPAGSPVQAAPFKTTAGHGMQSRRPPLAIIAGPTAVGKTAVSVRLAQLLGQTSVPWTCAPGGALCGGEIVSADSIQVYRGLDIGSAKVRAEEMQGVPHHLIDVMEPWERYDAAAFQRMADEALRGIYARGHIPILAGGTGFYIQGLLYGIDFSEEDEAEKSRIRAQLEAEATEPEGPARLYRRLAACDPASCGQIHPNNVKRVIRALEYCALHGRPISVHNQEERRKPSRFDEAFFVLTDEREALYARIDARVDRMLADGLVDEVRGLLDAGVDKSAASMQGIGYKEICAYLDGACTLDEAAEQIRKNSRNYAKRQLTWFKREPDVIWVDISKFHYDKEEIAKWITVQCMKRWA